MPISLRVAAAALSPPSRGLLIQCDRPRDIEVKGAPAKPFDAACWYSSAARSPLVALWHALAKVIAGAQF
jgi:hypothetical protein